MLAHYSVPTPPHLQPYPQSQSPLFPQQPQPQQQQQHLQLHESSHPSASNLHNDGDCIAQYESIRHRLPTPSASQDSFALLSQDQQLQQLEQAQQLPYFCATPLTPAPSQSQSQPPSFTSSSPPPGSAAASPTYSSAAFSAQNSPSANFCSSFYQDAGVVSMPESTFSSPAGLSHTPPVRIIHNSTPPFGDSVYDPDNLSSMLLHNSLPLDSNAWNNIVAPVKYEPSRSAQRTRQRAFYNQYQHHRAASDSSALPNTVSPPNPAVSSYPTSSFTCTDQSPRDYQQSEGVDLAMRRAILEQQQQQQQQQQQTAEDDKSFSLSVPPSVSTLSHNSPVTPHAAYSEDFEDGSKPMSNGEGTYPDVDKWMDDYLRFDDRVDFSDQSTAPMGVPKLTRTISDVYQDELYNPNASITPKQSIPTSTQNAKMYSPYHRNIITDRIQAAHQGHISEQSQSRSASAARHRSPWRDNSPFLHDQAGFNDAQMSQSQPFSNQLSLAAQQQTNMLMGPEQPEPKTISPKDALLDYNESADDANMSLFPSQPEPQQYRMPAMDTSTTFQIPHMEQFANQYEQHKNNMAQQFGYIQQQIPLQLSGQQQQQAHRVQTSQGQRENNNLVHHTPEFPRQLPSMESTSSDTNTSASNRSPLGPAPTSNPTKPAKRPEDTSSDGGTYSCTYHGCILRFETPAKLQKHKREAHRQTTPGSHAMARDSSAGSLAMRNSQAGPHRCERINPSTGKPCNSVFSRPYDLTRHEDTIHNARKQKVRCHLCTEEKTFSRNDALTRHMRVVHPEVDWPGKQKRKARD
ncbi:26S proteasome regulatory subunit N4 [Blastomyces parvus]|uniref:26S proteasome regulatory subunit N4 n=1 Tax=Blastomyces parvus TaxID=2060905 RepID=A0A2B7X4L3_9EURO|nr:26S proteasome regulatory subunit N4 [Blastomyces parvus]